MSLVCAQHFYSKLCTLLEAGIVSGRLGVKWKVLAVEVRFVAGEFLGGFAPTASDIVACETAA